MRTPDFEAAVSGAGMEVVEDPQYARRHRITVFGGSFDPIHNGHLLLARTLLEKELTDEILFVPARLQPLKLQGAVASGADRYAMIELAVKGQAGFSYSDIELQRTDEPSYMYDTMNMLSKVYNDSEVSLLIGVDALGTLPHWNRAAQLVQHHKIIVYPRPGVKPPALLTLEASFGMRNAARLLKAILPEEEFGLSSISSTQIREMAARHLPLDGYVPAEIEEYIYAHDIYAAGKVGEESAGSHPGA